MQSPTFSDNFKRLLSYLRPYWHIVLASFCCTLLVTVAKLSQAKFIGKIFSLMSDKQFLSGDPNAVVQTPLGATSPLGALNLICGLFLAMMATMGVATYVMRYLVNLGGQLACRDLRDHVFAHVQRLPLSYYDRMRLGEIQSRATGDIMAATQIFNQLADVFVNLFIVVIALGWMFYQDWTMTLGVFVVSPIIGLAIGQFGKRIGRLTESIQARGADLSSIIYESTSSIKAVKAYSAEEQLLARYKDSSRESYRYSMKLVSVASSQSPVVDFLGAIGIVAIVWFGAMRILQGSATLGQMAEYWSLLVMTTQPINALSGFYSNCRGAAAAAGRIFEGLDQPTEQQLDGHLPDLPAVKGDVAFEGVVFAYQPDKQALRGLSLQVKAGEVVAVVGSNGAGKTTLINLLVKFYAPTEGVVRIDGTDLQAVNADSLRRQIGVVTQESILFSGTIAENIALAKAGASREEIEQAAGLANAQEFIERMPQGYATEIGERGARLSGGQRQRIAIARALLRDPKILILDEFTSGIDPESEVLITDAIQKATRGRTCFIIAHRFNTIRHADRIIVLDEGHIVEQGKHDQLIQQDGLYRRIYNAQLKPKEEEGLVPSAAGSGASHSG